MDQFRPPECREATPFIFRGNDRSGRKMLEKSMADSGYTSELSTASESQISRGICVEEGEIDENHEPPTPTTRNLQKFSALQLTTPKCEQSPIKRPLCHDDTGTPKKMRLNDENHGYETPKKFIRKKSFRDRMESELCEGKATLPLSPISSNVSKSASKILGENQFENLSSTPIKQGFRPDFYVETVESVEFNPLLPKSRSPKKKRKLMKKIHSYSPRKWHVSQGYRYRLEQCTSPIPIDEEAPHEADNPAQGIIGFNACQFENLLSVTKHSSVNEASTKNDRNIASAAGHQCFSTARQNVDSVEEEKNELNLTALEEISSRSIKEYFHEMKNMPEVFGANSMQKISNSSNIFRHKDSMEFLVVRKTPDAEESQAELMDISLTPKQSDLDENVADVSLEEPSGKGLKRSAQFQYSPSVLHTPKKIKRPTSFQYSSDEEKHRILYPNLPCTPPKKRARKSLDYRIKSPAKEETPSKRCRLPKKNFYGGATTLNILNHLAGIRPALDRIFSYLSPEDLNAVHGVCRDWRKLVDDHSLASKRLFVHQKEQIPIKENAFVVKKKIFERKISERIVLRERNSIDEKQLRRQSVVTSPPSSPSTRNHRNHQKFLERLDERAKVMRCPKCSKSSLIMSPRRQKRCAMATARVSPAKVSPAKRNLFKVNTTIGSFPVASCRDKMLGKVGKSQSLPGDFNAFELELFVKNRSLICDGVKYETYAICSRESCRFAFCTTCFRERHEVGKCVELDLGSPVRFEEDCKRRIVPGSKRSKRNLKRL